MMREPSFTVNRRPVAEDYAPINPDRDEFDSRLQTVKPRKPIDTGAAAASSSHSQYGSSSSSGKPGPFVCQFQAKYQRNSLNRFRELDASLRNDVFPHLQGELPSPAEVEHWFWEGFASENEGRVLYCSGTAHTRTRTRCTHPLRPQPQCTRTHRRCMHPLLPLTLNPTPLPFLNAHRPRRHRVWQRVRDAQMVATAAGRGRARLVAVCELCDPWREHAHAVSAPRTHTHTHHRHRTQHTRQ